MTHTCPHCGGEIAADTITTWTEADAAALVLQNETETDRMIRLALAGISNIHTRRAYARELRSFLAWWDRCRDMYPGGLRREVILAYRDAMTMAGRGAVVVNRALSAVRRMVIEAAANGMLDKFDADQISRVDMVPVLGTRTGRWLDREELKRLLTTPPPTTPNRGLRDRAAICLLGLCGMRRAEVAGLQRWQLQQRNGRDILADVRGKGGRVRTVPIHEVAAAAIRAWLAVYGEGEDTDPLLPTIHNPDRITRRPANGARLYTACLRYCRDLGIEFRPHDLRRTFSVLAEEGGADLRDIQRALGHSSITTTEIYLASPLGLKKAAADKITL